MDRLDSAATDAGASVKRFLAWLWQPSRDMSPVSPLYADPRRRPHMLVLGEWRWDSPSMIWEHLPGLRGCVRWERESEIFPDFACQ